MNKVRETLVQRLKDSRSKKVVFLSHCILNENTRYLGGASRSSCIKEIVDQCLKCDLGIVQMPCPEQQAWGGVLKRYLFYAYGLKWTYPLAYLLRRILIILGLYYTRFIYRRLARQIALQIEDYVISGFSVIGLVGIDGSPSCAVNKTISFQILDSLFSIPVDSMTTEKQNTLIRESVIGGKGIFIEELQKELKQKEIHIPFLAHDLINELDNKKSDVKLNRAETF